jgi:hypothetical protein
LQSQRVEDDRRPRMEQIGVIGPVGEIRVLAFTECRSTVP